jgi:hypothetical protein
MVRKTPMIASRSEAAKHCLHDGRIAPRWAMDSQRRIPRLERKQQALPKMTLS